MVQKRSSVKKIRIENISILKHPKDKNKNTLLYEFFSEKVENNLKQIKDNPNKWKKKKKLNKSKGERKNKNILVLHNNLKQIKFNHIKKSKQKRKKQNKPKAENDMDIYLAEKGVVQDINTFDSGKEEERFLNERKKQNKLKAENGMDIYLAEKGVVQDKNTFDSEKEEERFLNEPENCFGSTFEASSPVVQESQDEVEPRNIIEDEMIVDEIGSDMEFAEPETKAEIHSTTGPMGLENQLIFKQNFISNNLQSNQLFAKYKAQDELPFEDVEENYKNYDANNTKKEKPGVLKTWMHKLMNNCSIL